MGCGTSTANVQQAKPPPPEAAASSPVFATHATQEARAKKVEDFVLLMKSKEALRMMCWDLGGQDTFYGMHHLYISREGVYAVTFNMEWFTAACSPAEQDQHLAFLSFWLDTIASHAVDKTDGSIAPIFLVGTHKDAVDSPKEHERISAMLDETFCRKAAWASVHRFAKATLSSGRGTLWFFPVDNSLGNKDPVMLEIKKSVQKVVQEEKYVNKMVPFTWLKVLEHLQEAGRDSYISLEEVVKLSQVCGMQHADAASLEEEVLQMLKTFNDLGPVDAPH
jgi:hypothetical protein